MLSLVKLDEMSSSGSLNLLIITRSKCLLITSNIVLLNLCNPSVFIIGK